MPVTREVLRAGALALVYVVAARLGLALDAVGGFATLVWAPTGIALAALVHWGRALWPGVFLGAVTVNLMIGAPALAALAIGAGNTLEAVVGATLLRRVPGFHPALDRIRDVLALVLLGALGSAVVASSIGVASLRATGAVGTEALFETWQAWWVGDVIGALLIAPLLLVWATPARTIGARWVLRESLVLLAALTLVSALIFGGPPRDGSAAFNHYMLFPLLAWAALRFGPRGSATAVFIVSCVAVWGTVMGRGPFASPVLHESLLDLQLFMGFAAATFMILAASIAELRSAEEDASRARKEAERANLAKAEFLAVMSHELRTPLNAISGYTDLLEAEALGPLSERQADAVMRMRRNERHLEALIEDVLSFARVETGRLVLKPAVVKANDALDDVEAIMQDEIRRRELVFERAACAAGLAVTADPEKLRQILVNLLSNASKYTDPGGTVSVGCEHVDGRVRFWVRDTGIGIPAEHLERVFDPFFQVERGRTRKYSGMGLGLSIARDLARAMQGDVTLESEAGRGTTAAVWMPAAVEASS